MNNNENKNVVQLSVSDKIAKYIIYIILASILIGFIYLNITNYSLFKDIVTIIIAFIPIANLSLANSYLTIVIFYFLLLFLLYLMGKYTYRYNPKIEKINKKQKKMKRNYKAIFRKSLRVLFGIFINAVIFILTYRYITEYLVENIMNKGFGGPSAIIALFYILDGIIIFIGFYIVIFILIFCIVFYVFKDVDRDNNDDNEQEEVSIKSVDDITPVEVEIPLVSEQGEIVLGEVEDKEIQE